MYYQDLSPYEYGSSGKNLLNIGWLEAGHEFSIGDFPEKKELLKKLNSMKISYRCRGFHCCDFCVMPRGSGSDGMERSDNYGNGEYRIGKFAAPALIIHYIRVHDYKPPQEFINAVIVE